MLNIVILVLILLGMSVHRYLSAFWEIGLLPYSAGFLIFATLFILLFTVNFIWMFGFVTGIVIACLAFFQVIHATILWPFGLPWIIRMRRNPTYPTVNITAYGGFSFLVFGLIVLTTVNCFISEYKSMLHFLSYNISMLVIFAVMIVGNLMRIVVMSNLLK